ncbi:hypothetical protein SDC9_174705 [bioreactor metagenome]|uniref:Uncharacterized protein n=1 Tax=bioreactor metagenome TaxID=1076179 RepID=A0A645GKM5_9ZZZZ
MRRITKSLKSLSENGSINNLVNGIDSISRTNIDIPVIWVVKAENRIIIIKEFTSGAGRKRKQKRDPRFPGLQREF